MCARVCVYFRCAAYVEYIAGWHAMPIVPQIFALNNSVDHSLLCELSAIAHIQLSSAWPLKREVCSSPCFPNHSATSTNTNTHTHTHHGRRHGRPDINSVSVASGARAHSIMTEFAGSSPAQRSKTVPTSGASEQVRKNVLIFAVCPFGCRTRRSRGRARWSRNLFDNATRAHVRAHQMMLAIGSVTGGGFSVQPKR